MGTSETPEQCPVCHTEYAEREQHDSATSIDCLTHSRICIQRFGTKFDVYRPTRYRWNWRTAPAYD